MGCSSPRTQKKKMGSQSEEEWDFSWSGLKFMMEIIFRVFFNQRNRL